MYINIFISTSVTIMDKSITSTTTSNVHYASLWKFTSRSVTTAKWSLAQMGLSRSFMPRPSREFTRCSAAVRGGETSDSSQPEQSYKQIEISQHTCVLRGPGAHYVGVRDGGRWAPPP